MELYVHTPAGTAHLALDGEVTGVRVLGFDAHWSEADHPRGQPENAGQFGPGGGSTQTRGQKAAITRAKNLATAKRAAEKAQAHQNARTKVDAIVNKAEGYETYGKNAVPTRPNKPRPLTTDETLDIANIVADHLGFARFPERRVASGPRTGLGHIHITAEPKTFTLNDKQMDYAGSANLQTGEITLYTSALQPTTVAPIMAHEVMHQKFQAVFNAYQAEKEIIRKDFGEREILRPDDSIREEFKAEFPISDRMHGLFEVRKLSEDDGITNYSREWWKAWSGGGVDSLTTVHETLAEMARLDWEGSLHRLLWFKESKTWKPLYEAVNDLYPTLDKR